MGLYERAVFNPAMDWVLSRPAVQAERARLLAQARGAVIEIGVGTGLNLPHYPDAVTAITAAAPAAALDERAERRARERGIAVELVNARAESLPRASGTFDTAVTTFVLCTVADPAAAIGELARVLRPGGRILFLEHVVRARGAGRLVQRVLDPIHRPLTCGCSLVRDTAAALSARFALEEIAELDLPGLPYTVKRVIRGRGRVA
ncbi:MAG TPA: class I SAM-dependent methyltransferase [Kofleriaceae bacterium]|nr:class I SAM-dependent methyltransferase [Kofleriaceae bacterium]